MKFCIGIEANMHHKHLFECASALHGYLWKSVMLSGKWLSESLTFQEGSGRGKKGMKGD